MTNQEKPMISRWKDWERINSTICFVSLDDVNPQEWVTIVKDTLCVAVPDLKAKCHYPPSLCLHCHQLSALSIITLAALQLKSKDDNFRKIDIYIKPIMDTKTLKCMVNLLQHSCQLVRYHVRRTLLSLFSLTHTQETLQEVIQGCLHNVLGQSGLMEYYTESLHLFSGVMSHQAAPQLNKQCCTLLVPHLSALMAACTHSVQANLSGQFLLDFSCHSTYPLYTECVKPIQNMCLGSTHLSKSCKSTQCLPPGLQINSLVTDSTNVQVPVVSSQGHSLTVKESAELKCPDLQVLSSSYHYTNEEISVISTYSFSTQNNADSFNSNHNLLEHLPFQEKYSTSSIHSSQDCVMTMSIDSQSSMCFYTFLCLVQKIVKFLICVQDQDQSAEWNILIRSIMQQLIFKVFCDIGDSSLKSNINWFVTKKALDVLDTFLNYSALDRQRLTDSGCEFTAQEILCKLRELAGTWDFPAQQVFIGGCLRQDDQEPCDGKRLRPGVDSQSDNTCNPVLKLLLLVSFKSCALCLRAASRSGDSDYLQRISDLSAAVLISTHKAVREKLVSMLQYNDPCSLDWLPFILGDQDDHWLEALFCLLDIFIYIKAQSANKWNFDAEELLKLIDPHRLFVQLLAVNHFDDSLFLDWLTSPETCFLQYLTQYLHFLASDFRALVSAVRTSVINVSCFQSQNIKTENKSNNKKCLFDSKPCNPNCPCGVCCQKNSMPNFQRSQEKTTPTHSSELKCCCSSLNTKYLSHEGLLKSLPLTPSQYTSVQMHKSSCNSNHLQCCSLFDSDQLHLDSLEGSHNNHHQNIQSYGSEYLLLNSPDDPKHLPNSQHFPCHSLQSATSGLMPKKLNQHFEQRFAVYRALTSTGLALLSSYCDDDDDDDDDDDCFEKIYASDCLNDSINVHDCNCCNNVEEGKRRIYNDGVNCTNHCKKDEILEDNAEETINRDDRDDVKVYSSFSISGVLSTSGANDSTLLQMSSDSISGVLSTSGTNDSTLLQMSSDSISGVLSTSGANDSTLLQMSSDSISGVLSTSGANDSTLLQMSSEEKSNGLELKKTLNKVMCLLNILKEQLNRLYTAGLMLYNPRPLTRLMDRCDQLHHLFEECRDSP